MIFFWIFEGGAFALLHPLDPPLVSGFLGELGHCILSHTLGLLTADCVNDDDDVVLSSLSSILLFLLLL